MYVFYIVLQLWSVPLCFSLFLFINFSFFHSFMLVKKHKFSSRKDKSLPYSRCKQFGDPLVRCM